MTELQFRELSLGKKYALLKEKGEYLGARKYRAFNVYLYAVEGMFVEAWYRVGLDNIVWIELQKNYQILEEYVSEIELPDDLLPH